MKWNIEINKVGNGYILKDNEGTRTVIEEKDDEKEGMTALLNFISEYFGFQHDKFGSENLNIEWNLKGRKVC